MTTSTLISEWLDKHGGPRVFAQGDNSDFLAVRRYLEKHGYRLNGHRYNFVISKGKFRRTFDRRGLMRFVDELRIADGLPPILARAA
ncbi:hypothetical protein CU102_12460 [Phyllobacterium brassicacearum]|uniref:Uncharacterized protein n=1 Tax=Phyllobacterium brassicacearum TaxID=314235 RepID=A0A2P7BQ35_9HYPH|nr:hypothetical protein [Phyllobacterium brassicacearum]PSH68570.1 hypothetical protein CU102_12460 [Phyllobacterium brassicacearum]TDQ19923.1 hypothetical protein DEV91_124118 [Phyllobacterium brassicacearum]